MNQARVKAFVKTWNQFRKDMTREVEWANGCGVPFSLSEVQESDFPGCMKQLRSVLNHSLFTYWKTRLCFESRVRNRARKMLERLEAVMVEEGPAWTEVTSHKVWCVGRPGLGVRSGLHPVIQQGPAQGGRRLRLHHLEDRERERQDRPEAPLLGQARRLLRDDLRPAVRLSISGPSQAHPTSAGGLT